MNKKTKQKKQTDRNQQSRDLYGERKTIMETCILFSPNLCPSTIYRYLPLVHADGVEYGAVSAVSRLLPLLHLPGPTAHCAGGRRILLSSFECIVGIRPTYTAPLARFLSVTASSTGKLVCFVTAA